MVSSNDLGFEMTKIISVGDRVGRLCVESLTRKAVSHKRKRSRPCAIVVCDCGMRKTVMLDDLRHNKTMSCGCLRKENSKNRTKSLTDRFWSKVNKNGPIPAYRPDLGQCWIWTAAINSGGYGIMGVNNGSTLAHRISYEIHGNLVADGLQIDHLCRARNCVNPDHLEIVTPQVNVHRGYGPSSANARKTHCPQGHPYNEENTYLYVGGIHKGNRQCRICGRKRSAEYRDRKKLALK